MHKITNKHILPITLLLINLSLFVCKSNLEAANASWPIDRRYRVQVMVDPDSLPESNHIPVSVDIDFGKLLTPTGKTNEFVPRSIVVTAVELNGSQSVIEHLADETFHKGPAGTISWIVPASKPRHYYIYFDTTAHAPYLRQPYIPIIGVGDNFRYNRPEGGSYSAMSFAPNLADFDGDGKIDLMSYTIYYHTFGQPSFSIFFWRNIGSNESPVYDDFVRLYDADGEQIRCRYPGQGYGPFIVTDYNNDHLPDLITESFYYKNTGKLNPAGGIVFKKDGQLDEIDPGLYMLSFIDHDKDGVSDLFYVDHSVHYIHEGPPLRNFIYSALYRRPNTAGPNEKPVFSNQLEPVRLNGRINIENHFISGFCDLDADGDLDVIGLYSALDRIPSYRQDCYWLNVAEPGQPPQYGPARTLPGNLIGPWPIDNGAYQGFWKGQPNGIHYFKTIPNHSPGAIPPWTLEDKGPFCHLDARCAVSGYSGVDVADWENDGDWDLIAGDERGYIKLIENTGSNERPVFQNPVVIQANFKSIRIERWHYLQDRDPEYFCGQAKAQYLDWDNDGDFDLVAANNTDRIVYYENIGSRTKPQFSAGIVLKVANDEAPWIKRCRPGLADFTGDNLPDLVTFSKDLYLCLYRRDPAAGVAQLMPGQPLLTTDGQPITIPTTENYSPQPEVCDWDNDGDLDIITAIGASTHKGPALWENVGSNKNPVFKQAVRLNCWGKHIMLGRHEQTHAAVDWFGSGKLDLVCGGESGWFFYFHRSTLDNPEPPKVIIGDIQTKPNH